MDTNYQGEKSAVRCYRAGDLMSPYLSRFGMVSAEPGTPESLPLYPSGGVGLLINLGDPVTVNNQIVGRGLFLDGAAARGAKLRTGLKPRLVRVQFKPGAFSLFFNVNLKLAGGGATNLERLVNLGDTRDFLNYLESLDCDHSVMVSIESWLMCRKLTPSEGSLRVAQAIHTILDRRFEVKLDELSSSSGVDGRKLQRLFSRCVGMSPKRLTKLMRTNRAKELLSANPALSCMDITYLCGYYDQAHFNREFKEILGVTPSGYRDTAAFDPNATLQGDRPKQLPPRLTG